MYVQPACMDNQCIYPPGIPHYIVVNAYRVCMVVAECPPLLLYIDRLLYCAYPVTYCNSVTLRIIQGYR